jgi:hypothetical protein
VIVNFVGNFQQGYTGERSDEGHLAYEIEALGHVVRKLPRDEWREYVISKKQFPNIPNDLKADINIIAKWDGFYDGSFAHTLRLKSGAPVFYWVWDMMQGEPWHMEMVKAVDLYLGNDVYSGQYDKLKFEVPDWKDNLYYFPFDVSSKEFNRVYADKVRDVAFFGSWVNQGDRQEWLKEINKEIPVTIFSWNYKDWPPEFKDTHEAVYGDKFALEVARTRICLGFSVEPNCWGYWSNRVGKTLTVGGFLLQQYAPGMELFLRDGVDYFSSPGEAKDKIRYYLVHDYLREEIAKRGYRMGRDRFTSEARIKDLMILAERFIKKGNTIWKI